MAAKTPATVEELRAELDRVRRESLRAEAERTRADEYKARLEKRDREIDQLREQWQKALQAAEGQLAAAAAKIAQVSQPPPPSPVASELNEARTRAVRLQSELLELRTERDEFRQQIDAARLEAEGAKAAAAALHAAAAVRDTRADDAAAAAKAAVERAEAAEKEAAAARAAQEQQLKSEEEARALAFGAQERFGDIRADLDQARAELAQARDEIAGLRAELDSERLQARARESQMIDEVREREARMVQEVRDREAQLVAAAQAREAQLLAVSQAHEQQLVEDCKDASDQIAALTHLQAEWREQETRLQRALDAAREREAALDAELRVVRGQQAEARREQDSELDAARTALRKANADIEEQLEKQGRAEAHAAELQAVVDSLGRERATLRSEAGALRAKVELLTQAEERVRRAVQELEELRGENEFLNQELARVNSPRAGAAVALPKTKGA